jgi:hypothetical protein
MTLSACFDVEQEAECAFLHGAIYGRIVDRPMCRLIAYERFSIRS